MCSIKWSQSHLQMSTKCVYKTYIWYIYIYVLEDFTWNNLQCLICQNTPQNQTYFPLLNSTVHFNFFSWISFLFYFFKTKFISLLFIFLLFPISLFLNINSFFPLAFLSFIYSHHFVFTLLVFVLTIMHSFIFVLFSSWELFTSALADGFSLESELQQVSSSLQDSS